ncbi:MAG: hypothetical protein FWD73_17580 [Polyangiaceae bacterium]|nr:hypothetical protein [Polyangiaceae bacterium]
MRYAIIVGLLCAQAFTQEGVAHASEVHASQDRIEHAREASKAARREGPYTFCDAQTMPLTGREKSLCPLAAEIENCAGFVAACEPKPAPQESKWLEALAHFFARIARVLLWIFVAAVIAIVLVPIVLAALRRKRERKPLAKAKTSAEPNLPAAPATLEAEAISDAEVAMRLADEHANRGEYERALSLYLAASLAALAHQGAIQLARHRTNGEYVRDCQHDATRNALREIVAEVDKTEFGHVTPRVDAVTRVARHASSLVRATVITLVGMVALLVTVVIGVTGCSMRNPDEANADGRGLPMDVLRRSNYDVQYLATSIESLPIPSDRDHSAMPIVVVDAARSALDDKSAAHLVRWVERGGTLVLFGPPALWPDTLRASYDEATSRDLHIGAITGARVANQDALVFPEAEPVAHIGEKVYAAIRYVGHGTVVGIANNDLFTNIGAAHPDNAAALVTLFDVANGIDDDDDEVEGDAQGTVPKRMVRVAGNMAGVSPPTNPTEAISQSGLSKGMWHALVAVLVLFLAAGVRHARPRRTTAPTRRAFREHVEATGAFYGRAGATAHALASYGRFVDMRLRERLPPGTDPAAFLAVRTGVAPEEMASVYERATHADVNSPPKGDELEVIEKLRAAFVKGM